VAARTEAAERWADGWDEDEHYWAADEALVVVEEAGLHGVYEQVSSCGGVFVFTAQEDDNNGWGIERMGARGGG
jgi:hypothetical protein